MADTEPAAVDKRAIHDAMDRDRTTFHALLDSATSEDLKRASDGTKWNNEQLLFHMLFGFLIVRALLLIMRVSGRLPRPVGQGFAKALNSTPRAFNAINYWGSCIGARIIDHRRMGVRLDRVIDSLHRRLDRASEAQLRQSMPYPARWDPYFTEVMTAADLYHYGSQHFEHHRKQLTIAAPQPESNHG